MSYYLTHYEVNIQNHNLLQELFMKQIVIITSLILSIIFFNKSALSERKGISNNQLYKSCMSYLNENTNKDLCIGFISGVYETMVMQRGLAQVRKFKNFGFSHCGKLPLSKDTIYWIASNLDQAIKKNGGDNSAVGTVVVSLLGYDCKTLK